MKIGQTHPSQKFGEPCRSGRIVRQLDCYLGLSEALIIIPDDGIEDPLTYTQAMNDMDCDQWIKAMDLKMESMYSNSVWTLVDQPNNMDVKTAFLYGNLEESIYMVQPKGFIQKDQEQEVCHLADIKKWLAMQFQMKDLGNAQYVLEQCPKTPQEVDDMSNIPYASAVGGLMDAMLCTRPNICYSVGIVSRYQSNPGHARKFTSGSIFTLNGGAVVWRSIKQSCIADSTMEAEYVTACEATKKAVWLKKFLTDLEVVPNMHLPITLDCDNSGAVANSREPRSHK
ncbi:gag/pol protein [Cucumis melo var. makuwa]|uniref:Gag/pol protein n=1 Tax=Cucumis melo var. makuwa TaxID=1194695 RepID=A0A5D3DE33_CUCMM|nr:gag/pol protein [Cucumis melo var. makuwa]